MSAEHPAATIRQEPEPDMLTPGSILVEKYRYTTRSGSYTGVQWLAQSVDKDGNVLLHEVCRTRKEALEVLSRV